MRQGENKGLHGCSLLVSFWVHGQAFGRETTDGIKRAAPQGRNKRGGPSRFRTGDQRIMSPLH